MRILTGKFKGRNLTGSKDQSIRPTTNRVKESIFNTLQDFCLDADVADFFSGSGGLGLEALSRDARHVSFIEQASSSVKVLTKNLTTVSVPPADYRIIQEDAIRYAETTKDNFDLIFMDPPFVYPPLQQLVDHVCARGLLRIKGILVIEHEITNPLADRTDAYHIVKQKKIGRSLISYIYRNEDGNE
jgi:16S rRNA (guanine966-N2)-methyltransferase